jgi:predicted HicB family RNase H-like nuclease
MCIYKVLSLLFDLNKNRPMLKLFSFKLEPEITRRAMKQAKREGSNLSVIIRQFLIKYVKNFKEEEK